MFAGCATQRDYDLENLLFEEDALLIAKAEVPTKKDLEQKDTCRVQGFPCKHGYNVSWFVCQLRHCPKRPR